MQEDPKHIDIESAPEPSAGEDEAFEPQDFSDAEMLAEMKKLLDDYQSKEALFDSFKRKSETSQNDAISAFNEILQEFRVIIFEYEGASLVTTKQEQELKSLITKIEAEISVAQKISKELLEGNDGVVETVLKTFHELALLIKSFEQE